MAHLVVWSPREIDDVDAIAAYIAEDSESMQLPSCEAFWVELETFPSFHMLAG